VGPRSTDDRLSRISTQWTLIRRAHQGVSSAVTAAQHELMQRYCGAAYRYLLGALRDQDTAEELFQEFALRFVRGDFQAASPDRGRFRDYVKTALIHLVTDHHRRRQAAPGPLPDQYAAPRDSEDQLHEADAPFIPSWREELINHAWKTLAAMQSTYHAVLLLHVENPDLSSAAIAERLGAEQGRPMTAGNLRVTLHRARERYADLLVEEVARSLGAPTGEELVEELRQLGLLELCDSAVKRREIASQPG
jgi:RNA polymerase sigma-70 factor (ECF subfamily)